MENANHSKTLCLGGTLISRALTSVLLLLALAPALASGSEVPILGRVLSEDGRPVASANVTLEPIPSTYERARLRLEGLVGPEPVSRTRSAADGSFELAAPEPGMWNVVVEAPGFLAMERQLVPLVETTTLDAVEMAKAAVFEARLVDGEGRPVAGVVGIGPRGVSDEAWRPRLQIVRAGDDGVARLARRQDGELHLEALAPGHALEVREIGGGESAEIVVSEGQLRELDVVDARQRPAAQTLVYQGSALLPLGLTDEAGRLSIALAEPTLVRAMSLDRSWGGVGLGRPSGDEEVEAEELATLHLRPATTLEGLVLDAESGEPLAGALVWRRRGEIAVTDSRGRYTLEVASPRLDWVQAAAPDYLRRTAPVTDGDATTIALAPAASIAGIVIDAENRPVAGVDIEVRPEGRSGRQIHRSSTEGWRTRSSVRGAFLLSGLDSGYGYRLRARVEGQAPATIHIAPLASHERRSDIEVRLSPGLTAIGWIVDENDQPIAGAEVLLQPRAEVESGLSSSPQQLEEGLECLTDNDGRFELTEVARGRYDLVARAAGFAPLTVPGIPLEEAVGTVEIGTVVLVAGASIEGLVTDKNGQPISGAAVESVELERFPPTPAVALTQSDQEGHFVVNDLTPGHATTLLVSKEGFSRAVVSGVAPPTEEPVEVVLEASARLRGKIVNRRGEPIEEATVYASPDFRATPVTGFRMSSGPTWARTDADGRFVIDGVDPGTQRVTANAQGYIGQTQQGITVDAGGEQQVDFLLEEGATLEGSVTWSDGKPVMQASIHVSKTTRGPFGGNGASANGQTNAEGRYRVEGSPTGLVSITVFDNGQSILTKSFQVRPGSQVVDLVAERGFDISGQVVGPDGAPVAGVALSLQPQGPYGAGTAVVRGSSEVLSQVDGSFRIRNVIAGRYVVTANHEGFARAQSEDLDVNDDVSGVLVELERGATLEGQVLGLELEQLAAVSVTAFGLESGGYGRAQVDYSGSYRIDGLAAGKWSLQAQVAGRQVIAEVDIPEGVTAVEKDVEFGGGLTLTGRISDGDQPLAGARVTVVGSTNAGTTTGADGRFRFEGLAPGRHEILVMAGTGLQHDEVVDLVGDHELEIVLTSGSLSGTVRDAQGQPIRGAILRLQRLSDSSSSPPSIRSLQMGFANGAETDSRGYFLLSTVRQGTWRILTSAAGYGPSQTTVTIHEGSSVAIDIELSPTEGVSFAIALQSQTPIQFAQVTLVDPDGTALAAETYSVVDGRVEVPTVPAGRWELVVQAGDSAAVRTVVSSPGDQGQLFLPLGGTLSLEVPDLANVNMSAMSLSGPDGRPLALSVPLPLPQGQWWLRGGRATIPTLLPGPWTYVIEHEGRTWRGTATVKAGETTQIVVQ